VELPPKKRVRRRHVPGTARFLTFSCYRRLRLFDNDAIKSRFVDHLRTALDRYSVALLAWVVMPEHMHLILFSDSADRVPLAARTTKRLLARDVLERWRALDAPILPRLRDRAGNVHFWQAGGGYDRNVTGAELLEKIRYMHGNPVVRGLAPDSVSWPWSSARAYRGETAALPIAFDLLPSHVGELT
jgi:putative transposase